MKWGLPAVKRIKRGSSRLEAWSTEHRLKKVLYHLYFTAHASAMRSTWEISKWSLTCRERPHRWELVLSATSNSISSENERLILSLSMTTAPTLTSLCQCHNSSLHSTLEVSRTVDMPELARGRKTIKGSWIVTLASSHQARKDPFTLLARTCPALPLMVIGTEAFK